MEALVRKSAQVERKFFVGAYGISGVPILPQDPMNRESARLG